MDGRLTHYLHLASRFAGSLDPAGPPPDDEAWAARVLTPGERELWGRMTGPDRRHAVAVARRAATVLGPLASRPVLAAGLLHDVGKVASGLGTLGRVAATVAGEVTQGRHAAAWAGRRGPLGQVGRYLRHAPLGGDMLEAAGSDPVTVTWAREHHLPPARWTLPGTVARALKAADDD